MAARARSMLGGALPSAARCLAAGVYRADPGNVSLDSMLTEMRPAPFVGAAGVLGLSPREMPAGSNACTLYSKHPIYAVAAVY